MPNENNLIKYSINIETHVLVAVWSAPFVFQGCFKITSFANQQDVILFFRCEYEKNEKDNEINDEFSPPNYQITHLYNHQSKRIELREDNDVDNYALYILKYALDTTLRTMHTKSKQQFSAIDREAMQAMFNQIKPLLQNNILPPTDLTHIGFAVAIDFNPLEEMGKLAVKKLLNLHSEKMLH